MNRDSIYLPRDVIGLLQTLQSAGHTAYVVGGCVRVPRPGRRRCAACLPTIS